MRVAVAQFATKSNFKENLTSCINMINEAATCKPSIIVLPEFCNTLFYNDPFDNAQSYYRDHNQAWEEALSLDGIFLQRIAEQAKLHNCYIVLNITLRRDLSRDSENNQPNSSIQSNISVTSCVFSPLGKLIYQEDKQALTKHEKKYFNHSNQTAEILSTPFGNIGLLMGSESMHYKKPRFLALHNSQLLCNSMNTFSFDQTELHNAARACENNIFIASANKTGQSQIVSPAGKVLANIAHDETGFVFADVDLADAGFNNKYRPDGTQLIKQLRPELYQTLTIARQNTSQHVAQHKTTLIKAQIPDTTNVAIFATYKSDEQAIEDVCYYIENNLSDIIQLPELFFVSDKTITHNLQQLAQVECLSQHAINQISAILRPFQYVCTSLIIEGMHQAVLISENGLFAIQPQLHFCQRYQWTALGEEVKTIELPLEQGNIQLTMLTADDAHIPEIVDIAALNNIHVLLIPFDIQEPHEVEFALLSRAAEHRICIVAASREKSLNNISHNTVVPSANQNNNQKKKVKSQKVTGFIANLTKDLPPLVKNRSLQQNGYINKPLVKYQQGKITKALIFPIAACNKCT
jgi:predicted amidohydrolase